MEIEKEMAANGEESKKNSSNTKTKRLGGIKTMPFIFANEACERFATTGFHANMITYLTKELNLPLVKASNIVTNFDGTSNLTPLVGGLIADSFAGRFWTIIASSILYEMGILIVTISAFLPQLHPPPCPTQMNCKEASRQQLFILYMSLLFTSIGIGGIKPCVVAFAADQFDMTKEKVESRSWNIFNWYYFSMGIARLTALTVVVYIQENVGWGWGLGIPTTVMGLAVVAFAAGTPLYKKLRPKGSPLTRVAQVIAAALRKRNLVVPADPSLLYENKELDADISSDGRLLHTNQFRWFDRAAILSNSDIDESNVPKLWRLATVHRVEELKSVIRVLPIWAAGILIVTANSHIGSFAVQQARTMDRHLSKSFEVPPASLFVINVTTMLIALPLYERLFVPFARFFTGNPSGITTLQRIGIGFAINILYTIAAALVEIKRKAVAADHDLINKPTFVIPISVFWLVPPFFFHGIAEIFYAVGHLEFLYDQFPESMRSTAVALYSLSIALGDYIGTFMVTLVHKYTGEETNWLPDRNLNKGKLENYYWIVSAVQVVNLIYFAVCAWHYKHKILEDLSERREEIDTESAMDKKFRK